MTLSDQSAQPVTWLPSEYGDERFSLGRRAFNADEADCCACESTCANRPQGEGLPICRAFPLAPDERQGDA